MDYIVVAYMAANRAALSYAWANGHVPGPCSH